MKKSIKILLLLNLILYHFLYSQDYSALHSQATPNGIFDTNLTTLFSYKEKIYVNYGDECDAEYFSMKEFGRVAILLKRDTTTTSFNLQEIQYIKKAFQQRQLSGEIIIDLGNYNEKTTKYSIYINGHLYIDSISSKNTFSVEEFKKKLPSIITSYKDVPLDKVGFNLLWLVNIKTNAVKKDNMFFGEQIGKKYGIKIFSEIGSSNFNANGTLSPYLDSIIQKYEFDGNRRVNRKNFAEIKKAIRFVLGKIDYVEINNRGGSLICILDRKKYGDIAIANGNLLYSIHDIVSAYNYINAGKLRTDLLFFKDSNENYFVAGYNSPDNSFCVFQVPLKEIKQFYHENFRDKTAHKRVKEEFPVYGFITDHGYPPNFASVIMYCENAQHLSNYVISKKD